ncbi:hypothetical protein Vretimale_2734 [Volvox reticuliferus]|uniref:Uncharacterized protein n=1 Tax=Volvox reticuliferus TaxID=1737510 RepID=A0A8J4FHT0_9CHLO|nr:hypothetical protein Vretifemale_1951 [Volvox reticuliferus]GIL97019.1 hypothetical protein Vretimale_2734 [Volvox reticuliferus]
MATPVLVDRVTDFHTGLSNCGGSCDICCLGFIVPCALYGDTHQRLHGEGFWSSCCMYVLCCWPFRCCFAAKTRQTLRIKYAIQETPCSDFCVHFWCPLCALCQEARELQCRGSPNPVLSAGIGTGPR